MEDIKNIKNIVKNNIYKYTIIDFKIIELEKNINNENKNITENSFIQSKGRVNSKTENIAIKNIEIENKIKLLNNWKKLIDDALKYYLEKDKEKYNIFINKFILKMSEDKIAEESSMARGTMRNQIDEILIIIAFEAYKKDIIYKL